VTGTAVIGIRSAGASRLFARLRREEGIGLVELLIALLILNIGIFATLGAFTSAAAAIDRASHVSTAAAISDKQMETYRDTAYASLPSSGTTTSSVTGPDGRTYTVAATFASGSQLTTGTYQGSANVKQVTLTVTDPGDHNRTLITTSSTFSRCTQSGLGTDTSACKS
jgi:Tfp pilus assembly protein PilV